MIKDLGNIDGKILVFGGPYSNLHALQALRTEADRRGIITDNIICTGDIVGYCAYPDQSVQFIKEWGINSILGNVEISLMNESDDCGCNFEEGTRCDILSKQWFPYAQQNLSDSSLEYLKSIPEYIQFSHDDKAYFVLHGSMRNTSEFIFKSTSWEIKKINFKESQADVILAGHCGLPFYDKQDGKEWINAGVIGMPANDGQTNTWYAIIDNGEVSFHYLTYDHKKAHDAMVSDRLPSSYAKTLITGLWDNCDVLPDIETLAMGAEIVI